MKKLILLIGLLILFGGSVSASTYLGNYVSNLMFLDHFNTTGFPADTGQTITNTGSVLLDANATPFGAGMANTSGSNYLSAPSNSIYGVGAGNYTWVGWVNYTGGANHAVFTTGASGNGRLQITPNSAGTVGICYSNVACPITSSGSMSLGKNHQIYINRTQGTVYVYIDGVANGSASDSYSMTQTGLDLGYDGSNYFIGKFDEIAYWNTTIPITSVWPQPQEFNTPALPVTISSNVTSGIVPFTVQLNDTSGWISPTWANWSITNATTYNSWNNQSITTGSMAENITNTFSAAGTYNASLYLYGMGGLVNQSANLTITAAPPSPPVANFTYTPTSGISPLAVSFTDTSATTITAWNWTFGAANFSSLQNPSYTFVGGGNYSVTLNVTNASGTNSTTKYVVVSLVLDPNPTSMMKYKSGTSNNQINNQTPYVETVTARNITSNTTFIVSNFTWNPSYVSVNAIRVNMSSVNITGLTILSQSINNANGFAVVNTTNAAGFTSSANALFDFNITYKSYTAPGTADVFSYDSGTCKYYDPANSTWWSFDQFLPENAVIGVWGPISANFTASPTTASVGTSITFSDSSTGYPDAWSWNFGDGGTSTLQNPVYVYASVGNYTVSETAYMSENATVTSTLTRTGYINVTAAPPPAPIAAFVGTPTTVSAGSAVQFTDQSLNSPTSWSWVFGDGTGNTQQNPSHIYSVVGNYTVNLTATNAQGSNTLSKTNYIQVVTLAAPVAGFTSNVSSGQNPLPVQFTDTSSNMPTSWSWNFGDGNISALQNPAHTFSGIGNYTVNLTAYNAAGNSTATHYINVVSLSGLTRQDLVMSPQYTLTVNFVDSSTLLPIPVVTVIDSNGNNATTTAGTYTGTYPYESVIIYATSSGYNSASASYVVTGNLVETIQMTKTTTTTQNSNVVYYPQQIQIFFDDYHSNPISGVSVTATPVNFTAPANWTSILLGISPNVNIHNTTLGGSTDSLGSIIFPMVQSQLYTVTITGTSTLNEAVNYTYQMYPQQLVNYKVVPTSAYPSLLPTPQALQSQIVYVIANTTNATGGTLQWYNITYLDQSSGTLNLTCYITNTTGSWITSNNFTSPASNSQTCSYLEPNINGGAYTFGFIANQSVLGIITQTKVTNFPTFVNMFGGSWPT